MSHHREPKQTVEEDYPTLWKNWNFLRLLFGRLVTNAGDSLYAVAAMWLVHELTGSTVYTGIASSLLLLPMTLQFIAGPLVDKWPIIRSLVIIQLIQAVAILSLPLAAYTGNLTTGLLLVTIPLLTLLNQYVYPAQSATLPQIIQDDQLTRANSAFSFANKGVDMLFEAVGGILIALVGAATLFILDSVTFVVAALLFSGVRIPTTNDSDEESGKIDVAGYIADLAEGFNSLRGSVLIGMTIATMIVNFGVGMTLAVLPSFADIRAGPAFYGIMLSAIGIGTALGATIASRLENTKFGYFRIIGSMSSCVLWIGAVYAPWPPLAVGLFVLSWVSPGIIGVLSNTFEQKVTPKHLLGRVASATGSASMLSLPIGALLGGIIGDIIGPVNTMVIGGLTFGIAALFFALRPRLRNLPPMSNIDPKEFKIQVEPSSVSEGFDET